MTRPRRGPAQQEQQIEIARTRGSQLRQSIFGPREGSRRDLHPRQLQVAVGCAGTALHEPLEVLAGLFRLHRTPGSDCRCCSTARALALPCARARW